MEIFGRCYCHDLQWLILLPLSFILADVIANLLYGCICDIVPHLYCICGRCYNHFLYMADVIAMVADGICHMYAWADVFALYIIDGTAKCDSY